MASTTLNVGNAIGLAVLIAVSSSMTVTTGPVADNIAALTSEAFHAFLFASAGMAIALLISFSLPGKKRLVASAQETV
ncbi:hypothetical protein [Pantoea sp. M_5]|nr:hypothetical protein [Pantoea sp. M_5]